MHSSTEGGEMDIDIPERNGFQDSDAVLLKKPKDSLPCELCDFKSEYESILKRHKRDIHDSLSKSTSPKPKRRKKTIVNCEEEMEVIDDIQIVSKIGID